MRHHVVRLATAASAGLALFLTACGAPGSASSTPAAGGKIAVVTSTNVYADIVSSIGGDKVDVAAIITKTSQDPHSYEASAQDKLAVSKAKVVLENGGGYDGFLHKLAEESKVDQSNIITAVEVAEGTEHQGGHSDAPSSGSAAATSSESADAQGHDHGGSNEHVWYSLDAMGKLADAVAAKLSALDSGDASTFTANAAAFKSSLAGLATKVKAIKAANDGAGVAVTEPVPLYLLEAAGLSNKTPEGYSEAIEEGVDVPATVLRETVNLVSSKGVRLLAYNQQTAGPQTESVRTAAAGAGVPVVEFTETLPEGKGYVQWMSSNIDSIQAALSATGATTATK